LDTITDRTGMPCVGVLPWLSDVWLDSEDALSVGRWGPSEDTAADRLAVAVVRLPRTSNATDVDALAAEPGVDVRVTTDADLCREADLMVLPGSRATVSDLEWLQARGLADVVRERVALGRPVLGICGGYQMLTESIEDAVESGRGLVPGLGALPGSVRFGSDKVLARPSCVWEGVPVEGYEIHHGIVDDDASFPGGAHRGAVWGTIWHGTLECDEFRRRFLAQVADASRSAWVAHPAAPGFASRRGAMIDTLADAAEKHLDLDALLSMAGAAR
jgi:adenosylcobyric acid synthase